MADGSRRQGFAVMRAAGNAGFAVGGPLGALVAAEFSCTVIFVADGVVTLLFALYVARVVPGGVVLGKPAPGGAAAGEPPRRTGVWRELRARPAVLALLVSIFFADIVYRQMYSTVPVFLGDHGVNPLVYGWLLAINGELILCLELPATLALRRRPPLAVVGLGLVLVGLGYGALTFGASVAVAVAMALLLSAGEILYKTPATAYVADEAPDHVQGRFQSLYSGVSVSGFVLGPPLGGALYEAAPGLLWPLSAAVAVVAGGVVLGAGRLCRVGGGAASPRPTCPPLPTTGALPRTPVLKLPHGPKGMGGTPSTG
ncbi:MFS transporter [Streptomyces hypolithicus]